MDMTETNALFDSMLAAYRNADDPDRFLRELLMRLDDSTTNAVVAAERKLERLDAAKARLDAAREIARPDASSDADDEPVDEEPQDEEPQEEADEEPAEEPEGEPDEDEEPIEEPPKPKKTRAKKRVAASDSA